MSPKKQRVFELIPQQNLIHKVDSILNEPVDVKNRGGDYLIPFPRMMELEVQKSIYEQLLEEKRMTKRNLIAIRETAKKMVQKFHNYWEAHATDSRNYDALGKHCPESVWECFLDCKQYVLKSDPKKETADKWRLNLAYQIDDGKLSEKKKGHRPINRYIAEKTLHLKSHKDLPEKVIQLEAAVESVTKENRDIELRLQEVSRKQNLSIKKEWETSSASSSEDYFEDETPAID